MQTSSADQDSHSVDYLLSVIQDLSMTKSLPEIMQVVRSAARKLVNADGASFVLKDGDKCFYADEDAIAPLWKGLRFPMSACISGWVMIHAEPAVIKDIYVDPRIPADAYRPTFVKSLAMVPVRKKSPIAAIGTYWSKNYELTTTQLRTLQSLADSVSIAIENVNLYTSLEKKVKERTEELESFSYSVSHDLRAPIRSILGFSQILGDDFKSNLPPEATAYLDRIQNSATQMSHLISALLDLSKIGRHEKRPVETDLSALVRNIVSQLKEEDPSRKVEFVIHDGIKATCDTQMLKIALENLLRNAWKYTRKNPAAKIEFGVQMDSNTRPVYFVKDNGAGFDMSRAEKIFKPFNRLHTDQEFEGIGIGLATVKKIISRHGGRIWADSKVDEGATFSFELG